MMKSKTKWPKPGTPEWTAKVQEIKAKMKSESKVAMDKFEQTWGTRNPREIIPSLRATITGSKNPGDWGTKALKHFRGEEAIALSKLIRERFLNNGPKSSRPIKLGAVTPVIFNPTMKQAQHNLGDANVDDDQQQITVTPASSSLKRNTSR
jgi:hypothetical protein